jgi:hypothetical protein
MTFGRGYLSYLGRPRSRQPSLGAAHCIDRPSDIDPCAGRSVQPFARTLQRSLRPSSIDLVYIFSTIREDTHFVIQHLQPTVGDEYGPPTRRSDEGQFPDPKRAQERRMPRQNAEHAVRPWNVNLSRVFLNQKPLGCRDFQPQSIRHTA